MCESLLGFKWYLFCYFVALYDTVFFKVLWFLGSLKVLHVNMVLIKTEKLVIVTLQFQGCDENAEIDDWEDANFFVYKITDRYGFIQ